MVWSWPCFLSGWRPCSSWGLWFGANSSPWKKETCERTFFRKIRNDLYRACLFGNPSISWSNFAFNEPFWLRPPRDGVHGQEWSFRNIRSSQHSQSECISVSLREDLFIFEADYNEGRAPCAKQNPFGFEQPWNELWHGVASRMLQAGDFTRAP